MSEKRSPIEARELPELRQMFDSHLAIVPTWLLMLTMHGEIVQVLGGLGERLGRHVRFLAINLLNEVAGINVGREVSDQPSTDRAVQVHGSRDIFEQYPHAMRYVISALAGVMAQHFDDLTNDQQAMLAEELNHLATRHGVGEEPSLDGWLNWFSSETLRLTHNGLLTDETGASVFWGIVKQPETLQLLSIDDPQEAIQAIKQILRQLWGTCDRSLYDPYEAGAKALITELSN